jgi:hypothetical protein
MGRNTRHPVIPLRCERTRPHHNRRSLRAARWVRLDRCADSGAPGRLHRSHAGASVGVGKTLRGCNWDRVEGQVLRGVTIRYLALYIAMISIGRSSHSPLVTALYCRGLERLRQLVREMTKEESNQEGDRKGEEG